MAPLLREKSSTESFEEHTEKKASVTRNDSSKRVEKAKRIKQQLLNAQAQKSVEGERKTTSISKTDLTKEEKQNMENFFEWSPPPPPETMGQKLKRKFKQNPLIPVGALATVGALSYGLFSFARGDTKMQQYMMRARVAAQGGTIVAVAGGVLYMLAKDHFQKDKQ